MLSSVLISQPHLCPIEPAICQVEQVLKTGMFSPLPQGWVYGVLRNPGRWLACGSDLVTPTTSKSNPP